MKSDPRYSIIPARAIFDTRLTAFDVRVLAVLGTHTDRQGWCVIKQRTIAERLVATREGVNKALKKLIDCGWVEAVNQTSERFGKMASLYRVIMDHSAPEAVLEALADHDKEQEDEVRTETAEAVERALFDGPHVIGGSHACEQEITPHVNGDSHPCEPTITSHVNPGSHERTTPDKRPKFKRADARHRIPDDWKPNADLIAIGIGGGLTEAEVYAAADQMRDWANGKGELKASWDATFRNWLRSTIADLAKGKRPVVLKARAQAALSDDDTQRMWCRYRESKGAWPPGAEPGRVGRTVRAEFPKLFPPLLLEG